MKKIVKTEKKTVASHAVHASSTEAATVEATAPVVAPAAPVAAPAPAVVTTMTDPVVQQCSTLLDQVLAKIGDQTPLSADEVRRATKMKKGGAEVIPKILALCQQHGVTQIGALTSQEMSEQLQRGDALVQVGLRSALVQKKVKDSAMGAHGRSWQIGMTMYKTLQRMAIDDPELALGMQPVESFFQTKKTKGKERENKKASNLKKATKLVAEAAAAAPTAAPPIPAGNGAPLATASPATSAAAAPAPAPANGGTH
jgi:hypothetical protein